MDNRIVVALGLLGLWTSGSAMALPQVVMKPLQPMSALTIGFLGPAREVSHQTSASRDTAVLQMVIAPRPILTGGGEFSVFSMGFLGTTWRLGFFGMLELESKAALPHVKVIAGDVHYWRGLYGFSLAVSLDRLARRWFGNGSALEFTLSWRHESEHTTASNDGSPGIDYGRVPHIGNFLMPDVAIRWRRGQWSLVGRLQWKIFTNERAYTHGPGGDLVVRWHRWRWVHPFAAVFGEVVFGNRRLAVPDHFLVRGLLGIIVPTRIGGFQLFVSADVGHRKGLAVSTRETTLGVGVRAAFP